MLWSLLLVTVALVSADRGDTNPERSVFPSSKATAPSSKTTGGIDGSDLKNRRIVFTSVFGVCGASLIVGAIVVNFLRQRKFEVVLPKVEVALPERLHCISGLAVTASGICLALCTCWLQLTAVRPYQIQIRIVAAIMIFVGVVFVCAKSVWITFENMTVAELPEESRRFLDESWGEERGIRASRQDERSLLQRREQYRLRLQNTHDRYRRLRLWTVCCLLIAYTGACCGLPLLFQSSVSCENGYYWENHMPFLGLFMLTKCAELVLYLNDPTVDGELPLWKFLFLFIPSFLGYADAYQDAVSFQIASACGADAASPNQKFASLLSWTMFYTFYGGVVVAQWCVLGVLTLTADSSYACLTRLVHMDALAACISVPTSNMWLWYTISLTRTFGEDVIQAVQQALFVTQVKENYFMVVSILFAVMSSFKALYDACRRGSQAEGSNERALSEAQEQEKLRLDILAACGKLPYTPSLAKLNKLVLSPHYTGNIDEYADDVGSTPLMYCVGPRNKDTVAMVREMVDVHCSDVNKQNDTGLTALSFAKAWHRNNKDGQDVIDLLVSLGAEDVDAAF